MVTSRIMRNVWTILYKFIICRLVKYTLILPTRISRITNIMYNMLWNHIGRSSYYNNKLQHLRTTAIDDNKNNSWSPLLSLWLTLYTLYTRCPTVRAPTETLRKNITTTFLRKNKLYGKIIILQTETHVHVNSVGQPVREAVRTRLEATVYTCRNLEEFNL